MANTSNQTNGANNTLIVSSSLIPLSSASQLSSVNSSLASHSQPSLIAQNQLAQQQPMFQLYQEPFQFPQLYQQQQMFLPHGGLAAVQAQNHLQAAAAAQVAMANEQMAKKKANKQQKILSKSASVGQQMQKSSGLGLKSNNMLAGHQAQFATQNNQAVVISQLPNMMSNSQQQQQQAMANKKLMEAQKNKQIVSCIDLIRNENSNLLLFSRFFHPEISSFRTMRLHSNRWLIRNSNRNSKTIHRLNCSPNSRRSSIRPS